jgi:hypothetical protein
MAEPRDEIAMALLAEPRTFADRFPTKFDLMRQSPNVEDRRGEPAYSGPSASEETANWRDYLDYMFNPPPVQPSPLTANIGLRELGAREARRRK